MNNEIWKSITGFSNQYEVSNMGRVRSIPRVKIRSNGIPQTVKGRILKTCLNSNGYECAVFQLPKKTKSFRLHRIVATEFIPNPENKYAVNHKNGIKTDNRVSNLEWVTKSENENHARKTGLKCTKGEKASRAKLKEKQVLEIRENIKGYSGNELAKIYGVSLSSIRSIKKRRNWKHI